ncbi:hypothetical protein FGG08_007675, partial [Glutinoglossum americanum]
VEGELLRVVGVAREGLRPAGELPPFSGAPRAVGRDLGEGRTAILVRGERFDVQVVDQDHRAAGAGAPQEQPAAGGEVRLGGVPHRAGAAGRGVDPQLDAHALCAGLEHPGAHGLEPPAMGIGEEGADAEVRRRVRRHRHPGADDLAAGRQRTGRADDGRQRRLERDLGCGGERSEQEAAEDPHGQGIKVHVLAKLGGLGVLAVSAVRRPRVSDAREKASGGQEVADQAQAGLAALLRVELHRREVAAAHARAERPAVVGRGDDLDPRPGHAVVAVDVVERRLGGDPGTEHRIRQPRRVPAHVRDLHRGVGGAEAHHPARQDAEARHAAVLLARFEQQLHADADHQHRPAAADRPADGG